MDKSDQSRKTKIKTVRTAWPSINVIISTPCWKASPEKLTVVDCQVSMPFTKVNKEKRPEALELKYLRRVFTSSDVDSAYTPLTLDNKNSSTLGDICWQCCCRVRAHLSQQSLDEFCSRRKEKKQGDREGGRDRF